MPAVRRLLVESDEELIQDLRGEATPASVPEWEITAYVVGARTGREALMALRSRIDRELTQ